MPERGPYIGGTMELLLSGEDVSGMIARVRRRNLEEASAQSENFRYAKVLKKTIYGSKKSK